MFLVLMKIPWLLKHWQEMQLFNPHKNKKVIEKFTASICHHTDMSTHKPGQKRHKKLQLE